MLPLGGGPQAVPGAESDPEYQAAVAAAAEKTRRVQAEQQRQHDLINASLQPALDSLADQSKQSRLSTLSNMEGRGMLRSGETNTHLTDVENTRLAGEGAARTGIANRISDLDAGTQDQLAQIVSDQSTAYAQAQNRSAAAQAQADAQWQAWLQQQQIQQQQQQFAAQQAQQARDEQERQWEATQAAIAAAGGGGGGGGGRGRGGGGGGAAPAPAGGGGGVDVGGILAAGAAQGLDPYQMAALEELARGGKPTSDRVTTIARTGQAR